MNTVGRRWHYRSTVVVLCMFAFFATMVARLVISPVVPQIVDTFDSSSSVVGLALTTMWMAYAFAQFPSGVLADRYGERTIILSAVGLTAVASTLLALAPSILTFIFLTTILGSVAGLHYSVATTFLSRQFDNVGTAIGLHNSGAPLAGLLAPLVAAAVAVSIGWRGSIALGTVAAVPIFVAFAWKIRPTEPARPNQPLGERFALGPAKELLSRGPIAFTTFLAICGEFVWQATASFLPTFLIVSHGYSAALASGLFSAYFVVHGLTQPVIGRLSDRLGRDRIAATCAGIGVAGYSLLIGGSSFSVVISAVVLIGIAMSWSAAVLPRFMDNLSATERAAGFGLVRTTYMIISATGSAIVGTVAAFAGWNAAFGIFILFLVSVCVALAINHVFDFNL